MLAHSPISAFPISSLGYPVLKGAIQAAVNVRQTYLVDSSANATYKADAKQSP